MKKLILNLKIVKSHYKFNLILYLFHEDYIQPEATSNSPHYKFDFNIKPFVLLFLKGVISFISCKMIPILNKGNGQDIEFEYNFLSL